MNSTKPGFLAQLKRRNVLRASVLYIGAVWALSQGIAQLSPAFDLPAGVTRWFVIAAAIGLPFWIAFAWFYELTPQGIRRDSTVAEDAPSRLSATRKLDFAIIGVLVIAVILLGLGYFVRHATAPHGVSTPTATTIPQKSVAVLPFTNDNPASNQRYFSDGLSEDLITALSQFAGLKVISRNSAFQFRDSRDSPAQIGRLLGVAHLLEGTVQREGSEVRITATLVNASDGTIIWSHRYDKPYTDLFALQDAITASVAAALKARLLAAPGAVMQSERPPSGSLAAWTAFQHGNAYAALGTEASARAAIAAYQQAIHLDPGYAAAYARLSAAWLALWSAGGAATSGTIEDALANARSAVDTALRLDPDSALAHQAQAYLLLTGMDWSGAELAARTALRLAPDAPDAQFWQGVTMGSLGRNQRALDLVRKALTSDPRSAPRYKWEGIYLAALGRLDDARNAIHTAISLQPGATDFHEQLAVVEILRGNAKAALAAAQDETPGLWRQIATTLALQIGPDRAASNAALQSLVANHANDAAYQIAEVYALRGDADATFKWLDRAWANRDGGISQLLSDPLLLRYRNDPRFATFCRQAGLPATTDAVAMK